MKREDVVNLILNERYYTVEDLRFNQKIGIMLSKDELSAFMTEKDRLIDERFFAMKTIPLKTFNSKHCFFVNGKYLLSVHKEYVNILLSDLELNQSILFDRNMDDMLISRLYSEVEGSLDIENVPTTHRRIAEISKQETVTDENDIIVKNMLKALEYIIGEKPAFNKENLYKLYCILSKDCLPEESKLKEGACYRDDKVYIGGYEGADPAIIDACMDSMFAFANDPRFIKEYNTLLPYICHYYLLYVHPYFDYNGRTARMVSFWLNYIHKIATAPYFMSEAINDSKSDYYRAIVNTRTTNNDLTYFLGYILETSVKYSFIYKNLEEIRKELSKKGDTLTSTQWGYVKKILVHNQEDYFNYKMFLQYIHATMTKAGAFKVLNQLVEYEILEKSKNRKGETIFKMNREFITYKYKK